MFPSDGIGLEVLAAKYRISASDRPMNVGEVAVRLGVSVQEVYKIAPSIGGYFRIGKRIKFSRNKFERWFDELISNGKGTAK